MTEFNYPTVCQDYTREQLFALLPPEYFRAGIHTIECSEGWYWVLAAAFTAIQQQLAHMTDEQRAEFRIAQIKEKFNGLRFYVDGSTPEIDGIISMAEYVCDYVCWNCGRGYTNKPHCKVHRDGEPTT
jgi:hypothetical protein